MSAVEQSLLISLFLSLLLALVCAAVPWPMRRVSNRLLAGGLVAGVLLSLVAVVLALPLYPWSNLVVLLVALTAGLLLARALPPRFRPFLILFTILSALDVAQIALTGGLTPLPSAVPAHPAHAPAGALLYLNSYLVLPTGHFQLGIFDLVVITAAAEYWHRRGGTYLFALLPGVLGFLLAYGAVWLAQRGGWPLIPFITAGWLISTAVARIRSRVVGSVLAKRM